MSYLLLSAAWVIIALLLGFAISYSYRIKNIAQVGLGFIFCSFFLGLLILAFAVSEIL